MNPPCGRASQTATLDRSSRMTVSVRSPRRIEATHNRHRGAGQTQIRRTRGTRGRTTATSVRCSLLEASGRRSKRMPDLLRKIGLTLWRGLRLRCRKRRRSGSSRMSRSSATGNRAAPLPRRGRNSERPNRSRKSRSTKPAIVKLETPGGQKAPGFFIAWSANLHDSCCEPDSVGGLSEARYTGSRLWICRAVRESG